VLPAGAIPGVDAEVPITMIGYHGTVYYHYDFPDGRSLWIKVDAGAEQAAAGAAMPSDSQLKALDTMSDIRKIATETVDGVDGSTIRIATHFSDWGVAVKVTPPTGAVDIKDLQKQQQG
jgi:hypothetical protein